MVMPSARELLAAANAMRQGRQSGLRAGAVSNRGAQRLRRLTAGGLLQAVRAEQAALRGLPTQAVLGGGDVAGLQYQFRQRGLNALLSRARGSTPIDTGRLRSSMRLIEASNGATATLSWRTPYAASVQFRDNRSQNYVQRAVRAGVGSANALRPRGLPGRIRNFRWQGERTIRGNKRTGWVSTRVTIPPPPR